MHQNGLADGLSAQSAGPAVELTALSKFPSWIKGRTMREAMEGNAEGGNRESERMEGI